MIVQYLIFWLIFFLSFFQVSQAVWAAWASSRPSMCLTTTSQTFLLHSASWKTSGFWLPRKKDPVSSSQHKQMNCCFPSSQLQQDRGDSQGFWKLSSSQLPWPELKPDWDPPRKLWILEFEFQKTFFHVPVFTSNWHLHLFLEPPYSHIEGASHVRQQADRDSQGNRQACEPGIGLDSEFLDIVAHNPADVYLLLSFII